MLQKYKNTWQNEKFTKNGVRKFRLCHNWKGVIAFQVIQNLYQLCKKWQLKQTRVSH